MGITDYTGMFPADNSMTVFIQSVSVNYGISILAITIILAIIFIWEAVWKLLGMWRAGRNNSPIWFVVLGITNTLGILPILYIYVFSNWKKKTPKKKFKKKK